MSKMTFTSDESTEWHRRFIKAGISKSAGDSSALISEANTLLKSHHCQPFSLFDVIGIIPYGQELGQVLDATILTYGSEKQLKTVVGFTVANHIVHELPPDKVFPFRPLRGYVGFLNNGIFVAGPEYAQVFPYYRAVDAKAIPSARDNHYAFSSNGKSIGIKGDVMNISLNGVGTRDWLDIFILTSIKGIFSSSKVSDTYWPTLREFFEQVQTMARAYLSENSLRPCANCRTRNYVTDRYCASCGNPI